MVNARIALACSAAGAVLFLSGAASATPYPDAIGEQAGTNDSEVDIAGVEVTRDLNNVNFQIKLNADISTVNFGNYLIGIQTGPGGSTDLNNPWTKPIGISSGMSFWVGSWVNFGGGAQLYAWDGNAWNQVGGTIFPTLVPDSTTISIPLTSLGLSSGSTFKFDVWSTYGTPGGQSAYDALNNPQTTVAEPWNGTPYDSAIAGPLASFTVIDGDANSDGSVGFADLVALAQNYNSPTGGDWTRGDFNGDGIVTFEDLVILAQHYGQGAGQAAGVPAPLPEPGAGLIAGTLGLFSRQRRPKV
jgi:hypothetical protein